MRQFLAVIRSHYFFKDLCFGLNDLEIRKKIGQHFSFFSLTTFRKFRKKTILYSFATVAPFLKFEPSCQVSEEVFKAFLSKGTHMHEAVDTLIIQLTLMKLKFCIKCTSSRYFTKKKNLCQRWHLIPRPSDLCLFASTLTSFQVFESL